MVANSSAVSHARVFVDTLADWVEAPLGASVDTPYVITGVEDWRVIVDPRFHLQDLNGDPVMRTGSLIGSILHQRGAAEAIFPQRRVASVL